MAVIVAVPRYAWPNDILPAVPRSPLGSFHTLPWQKPFLLVPRYESAFKLLERMKSQGLRPQTRTYNSALNARLGREGIKSGDGRALANRPLLYFRYLNW